MKYAITTLWQLPLVRWIILITIVLSTISTVMPLTTGWVVSNLANGNTTPFIIMALAGMGHMCIKGLRTYVCNIAPAMARVDAVKKASDPGVSTLNSVNALYTTVAYDLKDGITLLVSAPIYWVTLANHSLVLGIGSLLGILISVIAAWIRAEGLNSLQKRTHELEVAQRDAMKEKSLFIEWCRSIVAHVRTSSKITVRGWLVTDIIYRGILLVTTVLWVQYSHPSVAEIVTVLAVSYSLDDALDTIIPTVASIQRTAIALKHL